MTPAEATLVDAWPRVLGTMVLLSKREPRAFAQINDAHLSVLGTWERDPIDTIRKFVAAVARFETRFVGEFRGHDDIDRKRAVYVLAYLARSADLARALVEVYGALLRPDLFDAEFRARIAATFLDDACHLVWDIDQVEPADADEPYDWAANLNDVAPTERTRLLALGNVPSAGMFDVLGGFLNVAGRAQ